MSSLSWNPGFQPGNYWVTCDRCSLEYRLNQTRKEWTGAVVCKGCWESRHPQDFVRAKKDTIAPHSYVRPEPKEIFAFTTVNGSVTDPLQFSAIAGVAIAGKAIAGRS